MLLLGTFPEIELVKRASAWLVLPITLLTGKSKQLRYVTGHELAELGSAYRAIAERVGDAMVGEAIVNSGLKLFPDALISIAVPVGDQVTAAAIGEPDPRRPKSWRRRFPFPQSKQASTGLKEQRSDYHGGRGCSMNSESCALPASVCQDNEGVPERNE